LPRQLINHNKPADHNKTLTQITMAYN